MTKMILGGGELFDIQLIILNDGSKDGTGEIIERYRKNDSRVFSYTWDNHGLSCSREKSLEFVKGQYIAFCDSDDWVEPDWLISMYSVAKKYDADLVRFRALIDGVACTYNPQEILIWDSKQAIREFFIHKKINAMLQMELIKTSVMEKVHFNTSIRNWEDQSVALFILSNCQKIVRVNDARYHYYVNPNGISNGRTNEGRVKDSLQVMNAHVAFCEQPEWAEFLDAAKSFRRTWMFGELKSMYKSKLHLPDIENDIINLCKSSFLQSLKEVSGKDKLIMAVVLLCPPLARAIINMINK